MKRFSLDTNKMEWEKQVSKSTGQIVCKKHLLKTDEDTGMSIEITTYPKGYMTNWHHHNCAHAIFVLKGKMKTEDGKIYYPGDFVYFPEGEVMRHGATDDEDCVIYFVTSESPIN